MHYQLINTLRDIVWPVSDTPEDLVRRDNAVIAQIASLLPANADEANIVAHYVAAGAHALDCLRRSREYAATDPKRAMQCTAQAASMFRQARSARSQLMRVQAERRALEANSAALEQATGAERGAIGLMANALACAPPAALAEPSANSAAGIAVQADQYAVQHRKRAALIRSLGRLPDRVRCGALSPDLVRAIVTGTSPLLRSLDKTPRQPEHVAA